MSALVQASLFSMPTAAEAKGKPVFGCRASWLCLGTELTFHWDTERERLCRFSRQPDLLALSDVCFLYKHTFFPTSGQSRYQCPALSLDKTGAMMDLLHEFFSLAENEAQRLSGHRYMRERDIYMTTAWQGETRASICNVRAA